MFRAILFSLAFIFVPCVGNSLDPSVAARQLEASGAEELEDALPRETRELLDEVGIELAEDGIGELSADGLLEALGRLGSDSAGKTLKVCLAALCASVLCSIARTMAEKNGEGAREAFDTVASAAVSLSVCTAVGAFIDSAAGIISSVCGFSAVLVPVLAGLAAVSGHSAAAASYSTFTLIVIEIINIIVPKVIIPALRVMLGVSAVSALAPGIGLDRLVGAVEKSAKWLMGLAGVLLSGALAISSVAASAADNAATRTARFVLSGTVPIVGGAISDAIGTITNCVSIVRTSAGAFGLVAGIFIVLPVVADAVVWMIGLNCSAWAAGALGAERPGATMKAMSGVVSITFGLTALVVTVTTCSAAVIMNLRSA